MRTTLTIDDPLYDEARRIAYETRRSLGAVINELLAAGLREQHGTAGTRELGKLRGSVKVADDFDDTPDAVVAAFEVDL